jgi:GT2 family glycosyltransferase
VGAGVQDQHDFRPQPCRMHDAGLASVAVIIVNHDGGQHLPRCLGSLAGQSLLPDRIVVMDNASQDGSLEAARQLALGDERLADRVVFHEVGRNIGFAAANNLAVGMCDEELVALLNPDAFPAPGWLAALVAAARRHPEAAAFGSRQWLDGRPGVLDGVGDVYHVSGLSWRAGHGCEPTPADDRDGEIFSACAAAAVYRRAAFAEAGGFDEDFFCYFEDVDLGFRLRLLGYTARYVSTAAVFHVAGAASRGKGADFAVYYGHRNLVWCFAKNMPTQLLLPLLIPHLSQTIFVGAFFVARRQFLSIVKAKWHALLGLPKCWLKRRSIQSRRRASTIAIWRSLDKSLRRRRS